MPCLSDNEVVGLVEGALDDATRAALLGHLDGCVDCRRLVAEAAGADEAPRPAVLAPGTHFDRYVIRELVGAGAMGVVYRAFDPRLAREVALKLLRPHPRRDAAAPSSANDERLLAEAHALARLAHPNVVAVYDVGLHDGQVYLAMELGKETLSAWLARPGRDPAAALRLVRQAGEGIAAAHATGILHRDVKPDNVLLGADGRARVTDFGLARPGGAPAEVPDDAPLERATLTRTGALVGTPAYMALEQLEGRVADERADQFAYAVMLVEALTGARPFAAASLATLRATLRAERPDPAVLARLPRWLRKIVLRALRAAPADRWRDLRALLDAVDRGPPLTPVRLAVGATVAVAAVVTAGFGVYSLNRVRRARDLAERQRDELVVLQARHALEHDPTAAVAWLKKLAPEATNWRDGIAIARDAEARGVAASVRRGHRGAVAMVAVDSDGEHLASSSQDGTLRLWDGTGRATVLPGGEGELGDLAFAPRGPLLATSRGRELGLWEIGAMAVPLAHLATSEQVIGVEITPDGESVVFATSDGGVGRWDWRSGAGAAVPLGRAPEDCDAFALAPDGRTVAGGCEDAVIHLWPVAGGPGRTLATRIVNLHGLAFVGDDRLAVAGLTGLELLPLDGGAGELLAGHEGSVRDVRARGEVFVSGGQDRTVRIWRAGDPAASAVLVGHDSAVSSVAFYPDGRHVASGSEDGSVRIWPVPPPAGRILPGQDGAATWLALAPDGKRLAVGGRDGAVRVWDLPAGGLPLRLAGHGAGVRWLAFAADGRLVSTAGDGSVWVWRGTEGHPLRGGKNASADLAIAPGSDLVAWLDDATLYIRPLDGDGDGAGRPAADLPVHAGGNVGFAGTRLVYTDAYELLECEPRRCAATRRVLGTVPSWINWMAITPDGDRVALSTNGGGVYVVDRAGGAVRLLRGRLEKALLRFSPDGRSLAGGAPDGAVGVWTGLDAELRIVGRHDGAVTTVRWTPDGRSLVTASFDHTVLVVDLARAGERILRGHSAKVMAEVLPDGKTIASVSFDGTVRLWPAQVAERPIATRADLDAWLGELTTAIIDADDRATSPVVASRR